MTSRIEQIILSRKRKCCKCGNLMQRNDPVIKYTQDGKSLYWCMSCEKRPGRALPQVKGDKRDG